MDNNVLSFILGVLSSLFVWWIVTHSRKLYESLYNSIDDDFDRELESLQKVMPNPRFLGLYIVVCGTDEFSSARRMLTSKAYNFDSFKI